MKPDFLILLGYATLTPSTFWLLRQPLLGAASRLGVSAGLVFIALTAISSTALAEARYFEFLYIEASEGSASGGHAAVKFDNEVFHFQHVEPGLLRAYRNDFAAFRFAYGDQENRSIHGHRVEVEEEAFQSLRDAFRRKLLIQNRQFAGLKALVNDRILLDALKQSADGLSPPALKLDGLGYFLERYRFGEGIGEPRLTALAADTELAALKQAIAAEHGSDFFARKREEALTRLLALKPSEAPLELAEDRFETAAYSFAGRYRNQLLNLAALDVLAAGKAPRPETLLSGDSPELNLSAEAIGRLRAFKRAQFDHLVKLMRSERSDWGYPFLVGMARLHALDLSIRSGRWVVLDRFLSADENGKSLTVDAENRTAALEFSEKFLNHASRRLERAEALDEKGYGEIEVAAGTLSRVQAAGNQQRFVLQAPDGAPSSAADAELLPLAMTADEIERYRRVVDARLEAYRDRLQSLYRYHLLNRNCATEIFRVVHDSLGRRFLARLDQGEEKDEVIRQASERWLGGYIDDGGWNSVPFAAFDEVGSRYRVHSSYRLPPYRERQIERLYRSNPGLAADIAESNSLTSSVYRWHGDDAAFLFFTQDAIWPRPLLGATNLAVAAGQAAYGLLAWPWDSGVNLQKSLKGIAVSIPELMFFNIRKGSFPNLLPSVWDSGNP